MLTLADRLADSARLAAKAAPDDATGAVRAAASDGLWAARHGRRMPLFALLDVRAVLAQLDRGLRTPPPDRGRDPADPTRPYDRWLWEFCTAAAHRAHGRLVGDARGPGASGYVPLLLAHWPVPAAEPAEMTSDYADAYAALGRDHTLTDAAARHWRGKREVNPTEWGTWWPPPSKAEPANPLGAALWARFAADGPDLSLHEEFEHSAAALYLGAADPELTREQAARLREVRLVLTEVQRPTVESLEEQHPSVGALTVFTLSLGEYGDFKRVNDSAPKIATPPRARLPNTFAVNLCWLAGYPALRARVADPLAEGRTASAAGVLQGVLALVLDDWRAALAGLRVRFNLYRSGPGAGEKPRGNHAGQSADFRLAELRPGVRWKTAAVKEDGPVPPPGVARHLFRRLSLAEAAGWERPGWQPPAGAGGQSQWWVGAAAAEDLPAVGFAQVPVPGSPVPQWVGPADLAPKPLREVLVIDATTRDGWVYRVARDEDRTRLRPVPRPRRSADVADGSFLPFRRAAVDALLDTLLEAARP